MLLTDVYAMFAQYTSVSEAAVRTNIEIDDALMEKAMKVAGTTTKRETVEAGLAALIKLDRISAVRTLRGTVSWEGDLDQMRAGRSGEL